MKTESDIWAFIYEFLLRYTGTSFSTLSLDSKNTKKLEEELKIELPDSIKRWIVFSDNAEKIAERFSYRDCFEVRWHKENDALSILLQGEDDYYWAVKRNDLTLSDPPIYGYCLDYETDETRFIESGKWADSVSSFVLDYLFSYFNPVGGGFCCQGENTEIEGKIAFTSLCGNVQLSLIDDILIFTNSSPKNWHYQTYTVYFLTKEAAKKECSQVRWLKENARIIYTMGPYSVE